MPSSKLPLHFTRYLAMLCLWLAANEAIAAAWQNPVDRFDVNANGTVSPSDLLHTINRLLAYGPGPVEPVLLTPPPYFDVNGDDFVTAFDSLLIINQLRAEGGAAVTATDRVQLRLEVTDVSGVAIPTANVGDHFQLRLYANDNRAVPAGVYAANVDITFNGILSTPLSQTIAPYDWYATPVDLGTPGLLQGAGGTSFEASPSEAGGWELVDSFEMLAVAPGIIDFSAALGTGPLYDVSLWGVNDPIPASQIELFGASLRVVPEPSSLALGGLAALALCVCGRRSLISPYFHRPFPNLLSSRQ